MKPNKLPINREIRARRIILIDSDGIKKGEFLRDDAIRLAEEQELDLVVVGGNSEQPVCKIMDYGKYIYALNKKSKKNGSSGGKLKEIKLSFVSDDNYVDIKTRQAEKFLKAGNKVKVTVRFKGREGAHIGMIITKCRGVYESLKEVSNMDMPPKRAGRQVTMMLSPKKDD